MKSKTETVMRWLPGNSTDKINSLHVTAYSEKVKQLFVTGLRVVNEINVKTYIEVTITNAIFGTGLDIEKSFRDCMSRWAIANGLQLKDDLSLTPPFGHIIIRGTFELKSGESFCERACEIVFSLFERLEVFDKGSLLDPTMCQETSVYDLGRWIPYGYFIWKKYLGVKYMKTQ